MADENKPTGQEENSGSNGEQPPEKTPVGSETPKISPEEQARRDAQAEKDKSASKNDSEERLSFLETREMERVRDEKVDSYLTENADKYPNVKSDDPLFKYAGSEDDIKDIATQLQNRFTTVQQDALASVQTEVETLTDEQIAKAEEEMEKETNETGKSNFGNFLDNLGRRKKA